MAPSLCVQKYKLSSQTAVYTENHTSAHHTSAPHRAPCHHNSPLPEARFASRILATITCCTVSDGVEVPSMNPCPVEKSPRQKEVELSARAFSLSLFRVV